MSNSKSLRARRRKIQKRKQRNTNLLVGSIITLALVFVGFLVWGSIGKEPIGEEFVASGEDNHLPDGNPLPESSTNPPTSGPHYTTPLPEGFYDQDSPEATNLPNPHGFIIHSMEHGYVVFWYNCEILEKADCEILKTDIRDTMDRYNNFKIIAFPWTTIDKPVIATSWGRMLSFENWDTELAEAFIERNRNQSPEPNAR